MKPLDPCATIDATAVRRALLAWYRRGHRKLPWRAEEGEAANPYWVLVSEVMLQQTQVATVVDYFRRFVGALPTVGALAGADEAKVLRLWQGLGYYRRAVQLHGAAKVIVERWGGVVPRRVEELMELPGIGRYCAGAVASIAYGERAAVLDGNVARVLSRLHAVEESVDRPVVRERLWTLAGELVPVRRGAAAGELSQALMELGAMVCTPRRPECGGCPLASRCGARRRGIVEELPNKSGRAAVKAVTHRMLALGRGGKWFMVQRPGGGLWARMWQMPTVEGVPGEEAGAAMAAARLRKLGEELGGYRVGRLRSVGGFEHLTTHRRIRFEVFTAKVGAGRGRGGGGRWYTGAELEQLGLSVPQRRALAMLGR